MFIGLIWPRDEEHVLAQDVLFHCTARKNSAEAARDAKRLFDRLASSDPGVGAYIVALEGERVKSMWTLEDAAPTDAQWIDGRFIRKRVPAGEVSAWRASSPVITWEADGKHATLDWPCTDAAMASKILERMNTSRARNGKKKGPVEVDKRVLALLDRLRGGQQSRYEAAQTVKRELAKIAPTDDVAAARKARSEKTAATRKAVDEQAKVWAAAGGAQVAQAEIDALEAARAKAESVAERDRIDKLLHVSKGAQKKLIAAELLAPPADVQRGRETRVDWFDGKTRTIHLGAATDVLIPSSKGAPKRLKAEYALVPADYLGTSHDPWKFSPTPRYNQALQERDYATSEHERAKVIFGATWFEPKFVLNNTPSAIDGAPIIGADGQVLGGNGRGMMTRRSIREDTRYRDTMRRELATAPNVYGLTAPAGDDWVLVRRLKGAYDPTTISSSLNAAFTQSIGDHAGAVSLGKRLPSVLLERIAEGLSDDLTLSEIIRSESSALFEDLRDAGIITAQNASDWSNQRGGRIEDTLSTKGAEKLRTALLGAVVDDAGVLALMENAGMRDVIERIAPVLLAVELLEAPHRGNYSMLAPLRASLPIVSHVVTMSDADFSKYFATIPLFEDEVTSAEIAAWIRWLRYHARGHRVAAQQTALRAYRTLPRLDGGSLSLFEVEWPTRAQWFATWGLGDLDEINKGPRAWLAKR